MSKLFNTMLLNFGYAEDGSIAYVPMAYTGKGFADRVDAIISLAEYFKRKFIGEPRKIRSCCEGFKKLKKNFCADCGHSLTDDEFDTDSFRQFLREFPQLTNDSYGFSWDESQEGTIWTPEVDMSVLLKQKNVLILISAEKVLITALEDPQELRDQLQNEDQEDPNVILG